MPELVTSISAAKRKDTELAVGNSVGSNIFNIFWILRVTALITPVAIPSFVNLDMFILGLATFVLFVALFIGEKHTLSKKEGMVFVLLYVAYIVFMVLRGLVI